MNNLQYDISVVVPIFNVERYLERCIDSILQKTELNCEIILVNDGSTDSSGIIAQKYKDKYSNIELINKKNGGLSDARNYGLEAARGQYVMFVDSDDYIKPGLFDALKGSLDLAPDCIVFQHEINENYNVVSLPLDTERIYSGEELLESLFMADRQFMPVWKYLYKRSFLNVNRLRFVVGLIHEDEVWTPIALLNASKCIFCDFVGYHYEIRQGSIMTSKSINKASSYILVASELEKQLRGKVISNQWLKKRMSKQIAALYIMSAKQIIENKQSESYALVRRYYWLRRYCTTIKQRAAFVSIKLFLFFNKRK